MWNAVLEWVILCLYLMLSIRIDTELLPTDRPFVHCGFWIVVAILFNILVHALFGSEVSESWFSGYVLEYTLSVDNLFIFQIMFKMYKTPESQVDKALLWGISAAAIMRLVFFVIGTSLFAWVSWIKYPLGLLLLFTAWKTAHSKHHITPTELNQREVSDSVSEPELPQFASNCARFLPVSEHYDKEGNFFQFENVLEGTGSDGKLRMTMLGLVVIALTCVDVVFALDAVAAKVTQTGDVFVNFSSSLFAMAAFRSLYHIIAQLTSAFVLLKYGIAVILAYVGVELFVSNWVTIPNQVSCFIIIAACTVSILGSLVYAKYTEKNYSLEMGNTFGLDEQSGEEA